ncbi:MAG TPA: hypothetical protein VF263_24405 [Longimicrobiaceae bacterium]
MWKVLAVPVTLVSLAGCLWLPLGDALPRVGLAAVERSPVTGGGSPRPTTEPGARSYFFADSLIAFRTQAGLAEVRFRVWNVGREPVRIVSAPSGPGAGTGPIACPEPTIGWELRRSGARGPAEVLGPGESREGYATPGAWVPTPAGEAWRSVRLVCMVFDPAAPRAALRLGVERGGVRYEYTFWYRLMEPPRED